MTHFLSQLKIILMELVFATHNKNKLKEVQALLPKHITLLSLEDIGCTEDIAETGTTIEENALIKANYVANTYNLPCFADDTGLLIDALKGAPGVYSARYAGEQKSAEDNMQKLLHNLEGKTQRNAHFKTVIALVIGAKTHQFTGIVEGHITETKQGEQGFGYDPIFCPNGYTLTFAQLPLAEKNSISHRGKAMKKLIEHLKATI